MNEVIIRALSYVLMIFIAYFLKCRHVFQESDGRMLAKLTLDVTLPAAIISSFRTFRMDYGLLVLILFGLFGNLLQMMSGYLISIGKDKKERACLINGMSGYNIGNFTLPFISGFVGPTGIIATCLYDAGNSIMCNGVDYSIGKQIISNERSFSFKTLITTLIHIPTFFVYIIMLTSACIGFRMPDQLFTVASYIGQANGPIAMFMVGMLLRLDFNKDYLRSASLMIGLRILISAAFTIILHYMAFLPAEAVKAATMVAWSPIASVSPAFVAMLDGNSEKASFVNTISLLLSIIIIPVLSICL
ncbi:MAG: hypothetical protein SPJ34_06930 [Candidatus Ornithospirochaeta sp.]|nr:hypothetical protein [Candidatus Ornithospirochaeta sp.]